MLVDVYTEETARVWLVLRDEGEDLCIEEAGTEQVGDQPDWLDHELEMVGWQCLLGAGYHCADFPRFGPIADWALEHRLAPGQPFMICMYPPRYYKCGEYGSEVDCDYEWDFAVREPVAPADFAIAWLAFMTSARACYDERRTREANLAADRPIDGSHK